MVQTYFAPLVIFPLVGGRVPRGRTDRSDAVVRRGPSSHRALRTVLAGWFARSARITVRTPMAQRRRAAEDDKLALARAAFANSAARMAEPRNFFDYLRARGPPGTGVDRGGHRPRSAGLALLGRGCGVNPVGRDGDGGGGDGASPIAIAAGPGTARRGAAGSPWRPPGNWPARRRWNCRRGRLRPRVIGSSAANRDAVPPV